MKKSTPAGTAQSPDFTPSWSQVAPLFERRGLMLDISRNRVPTMETLRQLIDALAALQYNELQLYTEHTFAYAQHEVVWQHASPMTAEEIREIDRYCAERGIELVPNQNSFGHMERWLRHEAYKPLAECPDGFEHPWAGWREFGSTLYPDARSADFMDDLYSELLPNFTSRQIHIGGDEPWELGKGRSAARVASEGKHRVYLDFMKQLFALAAKHGHTPQFWSDIIMERPDLVPELPQDVIPVIWGYEADSPFAEQCRIVAEAGFRNQFYVAPGAGNWNSFSGRLDVAETNIQLAAQQGHAHGARGLLLTTWGDNGHHQPWLTLYPALVIAAAATHGQELEASELIETIDKLFYPDQPEGNGAAICALGRIDAQLPQPAPPNSLLHSAFFANETEFNKAIRPLTNEQELAHCAAALDTIQSEQLDPEIGLSIQLNRAGLARFQAQLNSEMQQILIENFAQQWQRHCRVGGLADSLSRMQKNMATAHK
ncbi:beta-N-acetylhexosaminidase [Coraliomargarita sp. SDUM461004]|uniref:Beta-N-acetylhexosaminidase n=1 Tax=Thalassobacterium sedimentorum TaxID=3041258 RepID=A0ABU1AHT9_9BACT|nr:beta-N-acetylhexosaminidase [Coraliomargarita sp. SDUM461004]MDQ8193435.1 beta-N-acetylhexosaminidase [Coraliomargarita sp. SDUM461004]